MKSPFFPRPFLVTLSLSLLFSSCAPRQSLLIKETPDQAAGITELSRVSVAAVGDILMHGAVKESAKNANKKNEENLSVNNEGFDDLFVNVSSELARADVAFANLETPIAPTTGKKGRPFVFNAPEVLLESLLDMGFDVVSVANNHSYDQGRDGMEETLNLLNKKGLFYVGAGETKKKAAEPLVLKVNDVAIAFLGYTDLFNDNLNVKDEDSLTVNALALEEAIASIQDARKKADFVVVSIHWGVEYEPFPTKKAEEQAKRLLEEGADVILGHHPHVLQPIEVVQLEDGRTGFVVYSLGNFVSNQSRFYVEDVTPDAVGDTRDSVILYFEAVKRDYGKGLIRTELSRVRYVPVWTENNAHAREKGAPSEIRVVSIPKAMERVREKLAVFPESELSPEEGAEYVALKKDLRALYKRQRVISGRMGYDFLAENLQFLGEETKPRPIKK